MARLHEGYWLYTTPATGQVTSVNWQAQTFTTGTAYSIAKVKLKCYVSVLTGNLVVSIRATSGGLPTGSDLVSGTLATSGITTNTAGAWYGITFSTPYALSASTVYAIVIRKDIAGGGVYIKATNSGTYSGGTYCSSTDSGSTWTPAAGTDIPFECYDSDGAISDGLQLFYKCNDNRPTTSVTDDSGNSRTGTSSTNTENLTAAGLVDNCFDFVAASSELITVSDIANLDLSANNDITAAFWCYVDAVGIYPTFIHKYVSPNGWAIFADPSASPTVRAYFVEAGGNHLASADATGLTTGWHFVVARFDRDGCVSIDFDNATASGENDISAHAATDLSNTHAVMIAEDCAINANYDYYDGKIDCILAWNRIVGSDELTTIYNSGSGTETDSTYGTGSGGALSDKTYTKSLVAIGNDCIWYESTAGTMAVLTGTTGTLNTEDSLSAIEAYQKVFIVNKTIKKIVDLVNTKLTTTDIKPTDKVIPVQGTTLTGTSGASMICDYVNASDDAASVYGYRTTTATFTNGETVTGTVTTPNDVTFVLSAAETAPPHYYTWTVYGGDTTNYGIMPSSSSLMALYRGRIVINNDNMPHAWYMTKVGNPFKVLYDYTNDGDLSAVTYSNAKVGLIGDIIKAFIPYKDDLLIFGCANSLWILIGDPLAEGQLAQITNETGIWGQDAWCMDDKRNLYFFGNDGIYRVPVSETISTPENISKIQLPNLVKDWDLDKDLHRVIISFDPINYGVLITKTTISDGTCIGYWFDLITQGWFSESYPASCGIFSSYFYPAVDDTYRKFLVGCNDGYIREFDWSTKNDATTSSTTAISSYLSIVRPLTNDDMKEGLLQTLNIVLAGGAASGGFSDSDGLSYELHKAADAETCLENIIDGETAFTSGTWTGSGEKNRIMPRMRATYMGLKLYNSTASQTFATEKIYANIEPKGEK